MKQGWLRAGLGILALAICAGLGGLGPGARVEAAPRTITGGHLDWGVKASFRSYIQGPIANGSITLSEGATLNGNGTFRFPAVATGSYDEQTGTLTSTYSGKVFFTGHGGLLEMEVTDIRVLWNGVSGLLIADVVSKDLQSGTPTAYPDVEFAELDLTGVSLSQVGAQFSWTNVPAVLTDDGVPAFANFYAAGTSLDALTPTLSLEEIGELRWRISQHAFTSSSLSPSHATDSPATKVADPDGYFSWLSYQVQYYDRITGATDITFDGSVTMGNVVQGGYRIMFDNPRIIIDEDNNGEIRADVSYCVSTAACLNPWIGPALDVTLTTFVTSPGSITDTGSTVSWTFTPEYTSVGNQFDQELIDALDVSLRGHFRNTGSGSDANKPPAPITVEFDYICPDLPGDDRNFINNSPFVTNDLTMIVSDTAGNACDGDDDNDNLRDIEELGVPCPSATAATNPASRDSDGDGVVDGAECAMGFDPASAASKPTAMQCQAHLGVTASTDTDGDKLRDHVEFCGYGSDPTLVDTDGDGAKDGCEAASFNADRIVNVADMGMLATAIANPSFRLPNLDVNKDGMFNPADQGLVASFISPGGQCP
jgi:hypothetical protein